MNTVQQLTEDFLNECEKIAYICEEDEFDSKDFDDKANAVLIDIHEAIKPENSQKNYYVHWEGGQEEEGEILMAGFELKQDLLRIQKEEAEDAKYYQ